MLKVRLMGTKNDIKWFGKNSTGLMWKSENAT